MINFDELLADEINVDKLEAARRQFDSFVEMFFLEKDVISQHTLIMAAHTILFDLSKKKGISGSIREPAIGDPADGIHAINSFRLPENFFKHADKDPDHVQKFFPVVSHFLAMDAARLYVLLGGATTRNMRIFFVWFQLSYPSIFKFELVESELQQLRDSLQSPAAFKNFARSLILKPEAPDAAVST